MPKQDPRNHNIWRSPGGALFFKLGVPRSLRGRSEFRTTTGRPKTKISEPLGTHNPAEARPIRDQKLAYWQRIFTKIKSGVTLDAEDIKAEAERIGEETLESLRSEPLQLGRDDDMRTMELKLKKYGKGAIELELSRLEVEVAKEKALVAAMRQTWDQVTDAVASVAKRHGITIEPGTPLYAEIANAVLEAMNRAYDKRDAENPPAEEPPRRAPDRPVSNGERFSVAFEHYADWLRDKQKVRPQTVRDYTTRCRRFIEFAGDPPIDNVTIEDAQAFLDEMAKTMGPATVNLHHQACKSVFEHARAERHKFHGANPFSFKRRKHRAQSKAKYNVEDLNKFFASKVFIERETTPRAYGIESALPWVMAVGLFSGLTLEEVCQLRPRDSHQHGSQYVISVERAAAIAGELKRPARERTVPLHPALVKLGLLEYVAALPKGERWLFPGLGEGDLKGKRAGGVGKAFNRWRRALGIERDGEQLDFHSLRHTFGKGIEDAGIAPNDCARLLGHAVRGISASVYSAPELKRVAPLVAKVGWDGLRLPERS
jgi:integrase